jgi:hypothetical protein
MNNHGPSKHKFTACEESPGRPPVMGRKHMHVKKTHAVGSADSGNLPFTLPPAPSPLPFQSSSNPASAVQPSSSAQKQHFKQQQPQHRQPTQSSQA